jgi:hypothetical protein
LTDGAIGIEEPLFEGIDGGATAENEIFAELHLRKKQSVLNAGVLSFLGSEKGREASQPFLSTGEQIVAGEGIGEFLQGLRVRTLQEALLARPAPAGAWHPLSAVRERLMSTCGNKREELTGKWRFPRLSSVR